MDFLTDWLTGWLKDLLIDGIMGNLGGLFDNVNASVGDVAAQVGTTPAAWNAGVFSLIRQLSETVILPIAGMVLTFVATYELIQMLLEKNNMHEVDVANIYKWMFKTTIAILILSNTFNIVMAVFDVSQSVIASASGLIQGSTDISADMLADLETTLEGMGLGSLLGLFMQSIDGDPRQPGAGRHGAELHQVPVRRGIPGAAHPGVRGNLRGARSGYRHRRRPHRRDLGRYGLHGALVFHAVQDGQYRPEHLRGALRKEEKRQKKKLLWGACSTALGYSPWPRGGMGSCPCGPARLKRPRCPSPGGTSRTWPTWGT